VRYQFVCNHLGKFPTSSLCRVMQITRSGFYAWKRRGPSTLQKENQVLTVYIRSFFAQSRKTYGSPRILRDLRAEGLSCGKHRVARLMRDAGLRAVVGPKFRVTTDSNHALPVAPNLLAREFTATGPNVKWASDITYLWTREGWLYLAVVLDLFSRRIVGWSIQPTIDRSIVTGALQSALQFRKPEAGLLHHSDRGSQYASGDFREALNASGMVCSMSRKGNCWDNAAMESFFGTLKQELVNRVLFTTREHARKEVFEYIEVWYNRKRRHSTLGYVSPAEFENQASLTSITA
jgi:putative transposase